MSKDVKYIPECCKSDGSFKGHLLIKKPSVSDLFEGSALTATAELSDIEKARSLIEWSKKFYKGVLIENLGDGSKYANFEDLMDDGECIEILQEVALALVNGLTKKKKVG